MYVICVNSQGRRPFDSSILSFHRMAVIGVEPAVKYSFVLKGMQTRRKGQYNAELTLSSRLYVKPLITSITAIKSYLVIYFA